MKVACETCQTKYTIADEKVQGRAYRVRCKKCGTTFIVRGDRDSAVETVAPDAPAPGAVWFVLVAGVQKGPLAPSEIASLLASCEASLEHYAWHEGQPEWMPMKDIPELAALASSAAAAPPPPPADAIFASASHEPEPDDEPAPRPGHGGIFTPASPAAALFAKPTAFGAPEEEKPVPLAAVAGGRASPGADLFAGLGEVGEVALDPPPLEPIGATGARNENSVLFSLSALQGISSATKKTEDSGAGTFPSFEGLRPIVSSPGKADALDDIINLGAASPFQATLGAPVLAPAAPTESRGLLYALFAVAFILLAGIIVLVFLLMRRPEPVAQSDEDRTARGTREEPATTAPERSPASAAPETAAPASAAPPTTEPEKAGGERPRERDRDGESEERPPDERTRESPPPRESSDPLERLMNKVTKQPPEEREHHAAPPPPPPPAGNDTPGRAAVMAAMNGVTGAVRACAEGQTGTANIRITFAGGSGRVTTAQVVGPPFAGTPAGSCMARAVRAATVPPFTNPTLSVTFPFVMR